MKWTPGLSGYFSPDAYPLDDTAADDLETSFITFVKTGRNAPAC